MARLQLKRFDVRGTGPFPLDMLRYDACWPHRGIDVTSLDATDPRDVRTVQLLTYGGDPESARWASFGWKVIPESVQVLHTA